jgi:hypothetical protein
MSVTQKLKEIQSLSNSALEDLISDEPTPTPEANEPEVSRRIRKVRRACPVCGSRDTKGPRYGFHCSDHRDQFVARSK